MPIAIPVKVLSSAFWFLSESEEVCCAVVTVSVVLSNSAAKSVIASSLVFCIFGFSLDFSLLQVCAVGYLAPSMRTRCLTPEQNLEHPYLTINR